MRNLYDAAIEAGWFGNKHQHSPQYISAVQNLCLPEGWEVVPVAALDAMNGTERLLNGNLAGGSYSFTAYRHWVNIVPSYWQAGREWDARVNSLLIRRIE